MLTVGNIRKVIEGLQDTAEVRLEIESSKEGVLEATESIKLHSCRLNLMDQLVIKAVDMADDDEKEDQTKHDQESFKDTEFDTPPSFEPIRHDFSDMVPYYMDHINLGPVS